MSKNRFKFESFSLKIFEEESKISASGSDSDCFVFRSLGSISEARVF